LQQKSKHIDEMIENRKENIGVIDKKNCWHISERFIYQ
jgi:hypothetical protein